MQSITTLRMLIAIIVAALFAACASMGRPEGGPRDEVPPVFVRSNPMPGELNVTGNRLVFEFDENIQLEDPQSKLVVSPAQNTTPLISSNGRKITIELRDTLKPNTTYTIDFADAIKDLNESNVLDGFAMDFATGDSIDSLRISGMLFNARDLEPAQGMLVGVYSNLSDTAILTSGFDRITKTNQLGQFTIRGLKPGEYRIYAVNDVNRDYHWDRSEDVAFYDVTVSPSTTPVEISDTLEASDGTDSIVTRPATRYLPDDILLTWFNENYSQQYLKKYERTDPRILEIEFGAKADSLPIVRLLNTHRAGELSDSWAMTEASATLDTLKYWIADTSLIAIDTLKLAVSYIRPDSLERPTLTTDTVVSVLRNARSVRARLKKEAEDAAAKAKKDSVALKPKTISFRISSSSSQDLHKPISFRSETPVANIDSSLVRFETLVDTIWQPLSPPRIESIGQYQPLLFEAPVAWEPKTQYRITLLPGAVTDIYGLTNDSITQKLTTKTQGDYSSLAFKIKGLDSRPSVLEILGSSDNPVAVVPVSPTGYAKADYLSPGTYYARLFIDADSNGVWSTGVLDSIQPEETYYYPKKINLKKNWTIEQEWDIYELPIDQQKPFEIKKNKPKLRRGEEDNRTDEDEEDDEFFDDPFMNAATRNQFGSGAFDTRRGY